jgi:SAM-dependent methyltransferase
MPVECALCAAAASELGLRNGHRIFKCGGCRSYFTWPLPVNGEHLKIYSEDYFSGAAGGFGYADYERDKQPMVATFEKYLDLIETFNPSKGILVDVGAATGFFLELAVNRGWKGIGIEPSAHASAIGREKGLDVRTTAFDADSLPPDSVDVITLWDVIEHVPDPCAVLQAAHRALRPGGLVAINTPDSGSLIARVFGHKWHLVVPPEHLFLFNLVSLQRALGEDHFEIVVRDKIGKRFTLQYVLETLYRWQGFSLWQEIYERVRDRPAGRVAVGINLRDNMFLLARKHAAAGGHFPRSYAATS